MAKSYRASRYVRPGVIDEHSYNMFLDVMQLFYRLNLWETILKENRLHNAWHRILKPIRNAEYIKWAKEDVNISLDTQTK